MLADSGQLLILQHRVTSTIKMSIIDQEMVPEHDTEYVQKYNEDVDTTLILVRFCSSSLCTALTAFIGWSVLCG